MKESSDDVENFELGLGAPVSRYFTSSITGALLRRVGGTDHMYVSGRWQRTETKMGWTINPISEAEARGLEPSAFLTPGIPGQTGGSGRT